MIQKFCELFVNNILYFYEQLEISIWQHSLVPQTLFSGVTLRLEIINAPPKGSGVMPIPLLSRESPNLAIVNWWLIGSQEVSIKYRRHRDHV